MIEWDVTKQNSIGKWKDDSVFLLNDVESTFHYKLIEKYMEKHKYKQSVSECKKWGSLIKAVAGKQITVISKIYIYCPVWIWRNCKCFWNINWNRWNMWCLEWIWYWYSSWKKCIKYISSLLTHDDRSLSVSKNFSNNLTENFTKHKQEHNVSLNSWHEGNIKNLSILWLISNKNHGIIQNPVRMVKTTVWLSIFELNESIYFIFSNIFCGESIQNIEDVLVQIYDTISIQP